MNYLLIAKAMHLIEKELFSAYLHLLQDEKTAYSISKIKDICDFDNSFNEIAKILKDNGKIIL